jgi:hypothetical protein
MVITHFNVDDYALVRLALTLNPCSNAVGIFLRSENIRRFSLPYMPTHPNSREQEQSSALAARTNKMMAMTAHS